MNGPLPNSTTYGLFPPNTVTPLSVIVKDTSKPLVCSEITTSLVGENFFFIAYKKLFQKRMILFESGSRVPSY